MRMLNGTKPRCSHTLTVGWASVGASSDTSAASLSYDHDTPSDDTPFQVSVVTVSVRQI